MASKLSKAFAELRKSGWYCAFCLPCCNECAWESILYDNKNGPTNGDEIDSKKVLFNHSQDWHLYRTKGETMLSHSGDIELVNIAIKIIEKYGCHVEWDGSSETRIWVTNTK